MKKGRFYSVDELKLKYANYGIKEAVGRRKMSTAPRTF